MIPPTGPAYGEDFRIGLIALSTDLAVERDFAKLSDDRVTTFTTRVRMRTPNSEATFLELERELPSVAALLVPTSRLDVVVLGCTAASMLIGDERISAAVTAVRPGVQVTNPALAVVTALRILGVTRLALLTPYTPSVTKVTIDFLASRGIETVDAIGLGIDMDDTHARIPEAVLMDAARSLDRARAQAVFVSCTAIRALNIVAPLEHELGIPVLTSNQAAFWHAMRLGGVHRRVDGYGQLLVTS
jgi:maleate isomerase